MSESATAFGLRRPEATYTSSNITFARRAQPWSLSHKFLLVFILLLYASPAVLWPELATYAPAQSVGVVGLVLMFVERGFSGRGFRMIQPESYLLVVFLGAAVLSAFTALWPKHAIEGAFDLLKMVAIYFLIVNSINTEKQLRAVVWVMVLGGLFPAVGALHYYSQGIFVEGDRVAWVGIFGNPNDLAYALVILLPLAFSLAADSSFWPRVLLAGIIGVDLIAVFLTYSRGGMIILLAVTALMLMRYGSAWVRFLSFMALILALVFVGEYWSREEGFTDITEDLTTQQRLATLKTGAAMFFANPVLGGGASCSILAWPLYAPSDVCTHQWLHPHNTFMEVLSETGLLGFIPFILLLGFALWHSHQLARKKSVSPGMRRIANGLEISLWGFVVAGLSGGHAWSWFPYILLALIGATCAVAEEDSEVAR